MAAGDLISTSLLGHNFKCTRRTEAHIIWTIDRLARIHPGTRLRIIQTCYNTTIEASAGTHDYDAVLDYEIVGLGWWEAQRFLRNAGWACWYRHTGTWAAQDSWHIHAISLGYPGRVGIYVPGQVVDYYNHSFGLKGQHYSGADHSYFPPDINATIFGYPRWVAAQEDDMAGFSDWSDADKKAFGDFIQKQVKATLIAVDVTGDGTVEEAHLGSIIRGMVADLNVIQKKVGA